MKRRENSVSLTFISPKKSGKHTTIIVIASLPSMVLIWIKSLPHKILSKLTWSCRQGKPPNKAYSGLAHGAAHNRSTIIKVI